MLGNAVVPHCVAAAWNALTRDHRTGYRLLGEPVSSLVALNVAGFVKNRWGTPTATYWNVYRNIGERAAHNLANQIMYDRTTLARAGKHNGLALREVCEVNPGFVEWLMGFPQGWTVTAC